MTFKIVNIINSLPYDIDFLLMVLKGLHLANVTQEEVKII